jgi:hypothetical protein
MATEKDLQLVDYVYDNTKSGALKWEGTADPTKFVVGLKGKYKVTIDRGADEDNEVYHWLTLLDDSERELLTIYGREAKKIIELFQLAKRNSLQLDAVIDEIIGDAPTKETGSHAPITDEDIPF